jgi:hypothetical protein
MDDKQAAAPDRTAVWAALWRALHEEVDPPPHVLEDKVVLSWRPRLITHQHDPPLCACDYQPFLVT